MDVGSSDQSWTGLSFTECAPPRPGSTSVRLLKRRLQSSLVFGFRKGIPPFCRQPGAGASRSGRPATRQSTNRGRGFSVATCRLGQPPELDARLARFVHASRPWLPTARPWSNGPNAARAQTGPMRRALGSSVVEQAPPTRWFAGSRVRPGLLSNFAGLGLGASAVRPA